MFKALSNTNRLRIFLRLISCCRPGTRCQADDAGSACVGVLGKGLEIAPSTVSHHMRELHQARLVRTERRGQHVECWVDPKTLDLLAAFFDGTPALSDGGLPGDASP